MSAGLFISWAPFSRRTETLARRFGLDARFVKTPWPKRPLMTPVKYPYQAFMTASLLRDHAPEYWVMDPPSPLVALAGLVAGRRRVPLVVDMHTVAFYAPEWRLLRPLELPLLRAATAVLVTNESLAARVRGWGARAFVLPDPLPYPPPASHQNVEPDLVTVIATYSPDEPIDMLPQVARDMPGLRFAVTGDPHGDLSAWPDNLRPTGFLSDADYWRQLRRSAVVVVLTTRPDTLLSGGYEAMVLERPLVTSDQVVLREYFGDAAAYCDADSASMCRAVDEALAQGRELTSKLAALRRRRAAEWEKSARRLQAALGRPV